MMAYVLVYEGETLKQQRELNAELLRIGRGSDNDIVLAAPGVSGHHATIEKKGEAHILVDNDSANGVFVDGKRVARHALKYWEDIQILNYVLKFRPRARLPGEQDGELLTPDVSDECAATAEVDVSLIRDTLQRHQENERRKQRTVSYFLVADVGRQKVRFPLTNNNFSIGKGSDCDIRTPGWFAPKRAASIRRHSDGYYLIPERRAKTRVNGSKISRPTALRDGDQLLVRGMSFVFGSLES